MAIINSKVMRWYFPNISAPFRGGYWSANKQFLGQVPVELSPIKSSSGKQLYNEIVEHAEGLISLHGKMATSVVDHEQTVIKRQIAAIDNQLDRLVYLPITSLTLHTGHIVYTSWHIKNHRRRYALEENECYG
jgi:hypothetical protein